MLLLDRFVEFIRKESLFQLHDTLLVAVSGGIDSVVLTDLCYRAGYRFVIAHCNFRLRDEESERDKEFVRALAEKYGVEILIKEFDTQNYASKNKLSIQEAARELRYSWFNDLTAISGSSQLTTKPQTTNYQPQTPNKVLTAHHADDNLETMLMNFFRGAGIQGLRGMLPKKGNIVRPLLAFRKTELTQFATDHQLSWVEDSSNVSDKYSRNYFRNNVIPLVKTIYPEAEQNLLNNLRRFADIEILYKEAVDGKLQKLVEQKGHEVHIPVLKLKKIQPLFTIVHEIIKQYHFTTGQVQEVIRLLDSDTGKYIQSSTHRIIKNRNWLIITPLAAKQSENILIEENNSPVAFELGELFLLRQPTANHTPAASKEIAQLNEAEIRFPLLLRKWKTGDYFYPLGMTKKKKLARFFIDQKLSKAAKENVWVLEMNKKIIWVIGHRIDERFKITPATTSLLEIILKTAKP